MVLTRKPADQTGISIISGMKAKGRKEELALDHPGHFHEYVFKQTLAPFHWEVFELLLEGKRNPLGPANPTLILAPRDHAKTTNFVESYPLWLTGHDRLALNQVVGSTTPLSRKRVRRCASCIRFNARYRGLFGDLYPNNPDFTWTGDALEVMRDQALAWNEGTEERDPTFAAFGITSSVEGGRSTFQAYDDIVTFENSRTEVGREAIHDKYWIAFDPMALPTSQQVIVGTRFHFADFYAELIEKYDSEGIYTDLYRTLD